MDYNLVKHAEDLDSAWLYWYERLAGQKSEMSSRDGVVVGEILNAVTVISNPTKNVMRNRIRKLPMKYVIGEMLWYMSSGDRGTVRLCPRWYGAGTNRNPS